jgi:hypothetical protein
VKKVLASVAISLAGVGCAQDEPPKMAAPATTLPTAPTIAAVTSTTPATAELEALLLTDVPAGYTVSTENVGDGGPVDLEDAVTEDGASDARDALTSAGFDTGYQRVWVNADDEEVVAYLYRFADAPGAERYATRLVQARTEEEGFRRFPVAGISGANGFAGDIETGTSTVVIYAKGVHVVQLIVNAAVAQPQQSLATRLAAAQHARLP